jgi:hypothetical protein
VDARMTKETSAVAMHVRIGCRSQLPDIRPTIAPSHSYISFFFKSILQISDACSHTTTKWYFFGTLSDRRRSVHGSVASTPQNCCGRMLGRICRRAQHDHQSYLRVYWLAVSIEEGMRPRWGHCSLIREAVKFTMKTF